MLQRLYGQCAGGATTLVMKKYYTKRFNVASLLDVHACRQGQLTTNSTIRAIASPVMVFCFSIDKKHLATGGLPADKSAVPTNVM